MNLKLKEYVTSLDFQDITDIAEELSEQWDEEGNPEEYENEALEGHIKEVVLNYDLNSELKDLYNSLSKEDQEKIQNYIKVKSLKEEDENEELVNIFEEGIEMPQVKPIVNFGRSYPSVEMISKKVAFTMHKEGCDNESLQSFHRDFQEELNKMGDLALKTPHDVVLTLLENVACKYVKPMLAGQYI
jgi:hypothetical protein